MPKLTFFPVGNADCCRIDLANGQKLLFDFADTRDPSDKDDLRIDLPKALREDLESANRNHYDVVVFTHLDKDHYSGASEFFYLEHASGEVAQQLGEHRGAGAIEPLGIGLGPQPG